MANNTVFERIVYRPNIYQGKQRGFNQIATATWPTIGPIPGNVAIAKPKSHDQSPEILDRGGLIARRIQQIQDLDEAVGAMLPSPIPVISAKAISPRYVKDNINFVSTMDNGTFRSSNHGAAWTAWFL